MFRETTNMIHRLGVPANILGYQFLRDAVVMVFEDFSLLKSVTTKLYPELAQKYNTTPAKVERAIRHAIETSWENESTESIDTIIGCPSRIRKHKPTNSELIAILADSLRMVQCGVKTDE